MSRVETIGECVLHLGDCRDILPDVECVAAVLTDPPFGIDYQSGHRTDALWSGDRIQNDSTTSARNDALDQLQGVPIAASVQLDQPTGVTDPSQARRLARPGGP